MSSVLNEAYNYDVIINGLNGIPLRTTAKGAKALMQSFHAEPNMETLLLEAVDGGKPFKNTLISVSAVFPRSKRLPPGMPLITSVAASAKKVNPGQFVKKNTTKSTLVPTPRKKKAK